MATLLEKAAVDNGFDQEATRQGDWLSFASSRVPLRLWLTASAPDRLIVAMSSSGVARALFDHGSE
jgi:putative restriction endonuclease